MLAEGPTEVFVGIQGVGEYTAFVGG